MHVQELPPEEGAVRRFVEDLWVPYHRDLEATVDGDALADDAALVAEELAFRLDRLEDEAYRAWVAVRDATADVDLAAGDGHLAGFVTTEVDESPSVFDRPDRLVIGDLYVEAPARGTGLARDLVDRAVERARTAECRELALDVDADNGRALAFYEKLGFRAHRYRMTASLDDL
jgi:ribosomal protein S18 acetylase RimI-like enzyme